MLGLGLGDVTSGGGYDVGASFSILAGAPTNALITRTSSTTENLTS
jgi:hypothetical protein